MLNQIIAFSIKNKLIIGLFIFTLIGYGSYQITQLPIDAVPDITNNQVQVITISPSLGAPDVERLITFPIEQANSNIPGLKEIRSFSRFGLSVITIVFEDDIDIYWARQQVSERLKNTQDQIPKGIGIPELAPVTTGLGEIYQYILKAKHGYESKYDATELRTIQDWIVKRQLISVKGVADVSSFGGRVKQYEIAVRPNILKSYGITIQDVFTAVEKNNENTGGSYIEKASTVLYIRTEGLIGNKNDIESIVVKNTIDGTPLLIKDVAEVRIGNATRYGAITYNDEGEVTGAVVMMLKGDNSNKVIKGVKEKIAQIQKTLPEGVEIEPFLDRTKMVNSAIKTVLKNLLEGALIVIFILVLFLGNLRTGVIVASVIPLSMLFAIIMMNLFGVSGNLMSLGALDFGLIVDGSVIIVEACMFQLHNAKQKKFSQHEMDTMVYNTSTRIRNVTIFGEMIILAVYLPIYTLEGIEGKMFKPMAQTVTFALLGAFILSLTYIPMMSALFLNKTVSDKKNISDKIMQWVEQIYQNLLTRILTIPKTILATTILLFIGALFLLTKLGGEFIPELPEGDFAVETRVLTGSNIYTSSQAILKSANILLHKFPEVEKVVGKIGSGEIPTDPMPMEAADMMVILKDKSEWTSAKTWNELADKMSTALKDVPGVTYSFQYPVAMRFNELMTGSKQDVVCKIFGENLDTLSKYAKILGRVIRKIEGADNIYVEPIDGLPQLIISYNRNQMAQFGLNIQDVNKVVNTAFAGQKSGLVYEDEKHFDLVVRLDHKERQSIEDIENLLIPTPFKTQVPLSQVANISIEESVNQIQREDAKRRIIVGFNVNGKDVETLVNEVQTKVNEQIKFPAGYYITYGGAFENLLAAKKRLSLAIPISLVLIFVLLYFAFHSIKQGLLIYSAIPLSIIGGVFFLAIRGMPFSISAGIGFIALFGVAVLNGIVLISEYNRIKKEGESDLKKIVIKGTTQRLRPVLMTASVASLGFLPMALSHGAGAEVQRPLATVVIGGLLIATFLTLFVLPALYLLFEKGFKSKNALVGISIFVFSLSYSSSLNAQVPIALQAAIDTAYTNNLHIKNERLNVEYQKKLNAAAIDIPQANFLGEYGQINSIFNDTKFGIAQNINFPTVYVQQKALQQEVYKSSVLNMAFKKAEIKKQVSEVFYRLIYLQQKQKLLLKSDSIFTSFLEKENLRFAKGASNILEKTSAETQHGQINIQLNLLKSDMEILQLKFQVLLNTNTVFVPTAESPKLPFNGLTDSTGLLLHPTLQILNQQKEMALVNTRLEKSKLLPDLNFGYYNSSIKGIGADDVLYNRSKRFQSAQIGIGIPLFFQAQKAKIKSSKTLQFISENNYQIGLQNLNTEYQSSFKKYIMQLKIVNYFEDIALPNADIIIQTAHQKFTNGDINYLEWTMLLNNAIHLKSQYTEAVNELNLSVIQLNYLTSK